MAPPEVVKRSTYTVEVKTDEPDTRHFMSPWCIDKNDGELASFPKLIQESKKPPTIPGLFDAATEKHKAKMCVGTRPIIEETHQDKKKFWKKGPAVWKTYGQVADTVHAIAKGLLDLPGIKEKKATGQCIAAVLAETSADWQMSAQAAFQAGMTITTIYTTLGVEAMLYGLNQTESIVLFVDWEQYDKLSKTVFANCPSLRHVVVIGECWVAQKTVGASPTPFPTPEAAAALPMIGEAKTHVLKGLMEAGKQSTHNLEEEGPKPEDLAFIMYTSGSTGMPKGVMLTHKNFTALVAGVQAHKSMDMRVNETFLAYLPLAHVLELMAETICMVAGSRICYGHPKSLTASSPFMPPGSTEGSDLQEFRPQVLVAVPAVLDGIKTGLVAKLSGAQSCTERMARAAVAQRVGGDTSDGIAGCFGAGCMNETVIKGLKTKLGLENLRNFGSGGAPLSAETHNYMNKLLAPVAQGYGATETLAASVIQETIAVDGRPADLSTGTVGSIVPSCELKLTSVPEMGYLVTDNPPRGEILFAGNTVSQAGYFKMEEKSKEDFPRHADGKVWFHTGDIGLMTENGTLKIIDRKKDLIKLAGGEYVSLGKVEAGLKGVPGISACIVFAQSDKTYCCVIVSKPERGWASVGGKPESEAALVQAIAEKLRSQNFAKFEIPTKVKIDDDVWTAESGLVTASMKVQRNPIRAHYNAPGGLLEQMDYRFPDA